MEHRDNVQDIQTNKIVTANGRCLLIVQSNLNEGIARDFCQTVARSQVIRYSN